MEKKYFYKLPTDLERKYILSDKKVIKEYIAGYEAIVILAKNVASDIQSSVHGRVNCHYNTFTDTMEISISNRVLNIEPFRYNYMYFSREMKHGISSEVIARFVVKEYKEYVDLYIFKRY